MLVVFALNAGFENGRWVRGNTSFLFTCTPSTEESEARADVYMVDHETRQVVHDTISLDHLLARTLLKQRWVGVVTLTLPIALTLPITQWLW